MDAAALRDWLRVSLHISVTQVTCQTWRVTTWSSAGNLQSIQEVEASLGPRLRLKAYAEKLQSDAAAEALLAELVEGQPPVAVASALLLRQWYAKYHPASGPVTIEDAQELDGAVWQGAVRELCRYDVTATGNGFEAAAEAHPGISEHTADVAGGAGRKTWSAQAAGKQYPEAAGGACASGFSGISRQSGVLEPGSGITCRLQELGRITGLWGPIVVGISALGEPRGGISGFGEWPRCISGGAHGAAGCRGCGGCLWHAVSPGGH